MDLVSLCSLPVAALAWRPSPQRFALTVVCKATCLLQPGNAVLAPEQEPLHAEEHHWDDDDERSLYAPNDLVPFKPRAEVLLVGSAHPARGSPVRSLAVHLQVGAVDKSIEVVGPRVITRDGEIREGKRWTKMPLSWEHAAGGPDTDNPVGVSPGAPRDLYGQLHLPNLQPVGLTGKKGEPIAPIGFGPIASAWRGRGSHRPAGMTDQEAHQRPFGAGFEPAYFQAAPLDQRLDQLRPGERLVLENLHPGHHRLVTQLPDLAPRAHVELDGRAPIELTLVADTLWIDAHRSLYTLTFRAQLDVDEEAPRGRILLALAKGDQPVPWGSLAPPRAPAEPTRPGATAPPEEPGPTDLDADSLESVEVTLVENANRLLGDLGKVPPPSIDPPPPSMLATQKLDMSGYRAAIPAPGHQSTQKVDMSALRSSFPDWLSATAPPPQPDSPPPPALLTAPRPPDSPPPPALLTASAPGGAEPPRRLALPPEPPRVPLPPVRSEPPPPRNERQVAPSSLLAASNAAASASGPQAPSRPPPLPVEPAPDSLVGQPTVVELIWFDLSLPRQIDAHPSFQAWKRLSPNPADPGASTAPPAPDEEANRALVHEVLARAAPSRAAEIEALLDEGPSTPPLALLAGELAFSFDEVESLRAVIRAAAPLGPSDKPLKEVLDLATAMLESPLHGMPEVAEGLGARIRQAWTKANRLFPPSYIEVCTERLLLEERRYQRRALYGGSFIRALFHPGGGGSPVPAYLPADIDKRLPLFKRFPVRIVAELLWQQDQGEAQATALRLLALGRLVGRGRSARSKKR